MKILAGNGVKSIMKRICLGKQEKRKVSEGSKTGKVKGSDGIQVKGSGKVRERWRGYFEQLMNERIEGEATVTSLGIGVGRSCPQGLGDREKK